MNENNFQMMIEALEKIVKNQELLLIRIEELEKQVHNLEAQAYRGN